MAIHSLPNYPVTGKTIQEIQKDPDYQKNCESNPRYLHEQLQSYVSSCLLDVALDLNQERRSLLSSLSIEYAKKTYQSAQTLSHEHLAKTLFTESYYIIEIFTNASTLHTEAHQKAWRGVVILIIESINERNLLTPTDYQGKVFVLTSLLPYSNTCFLPEDQNFFHSMCDAQFPSSITFLLLGMNSSSVKTPQENLNFSEDQLQQLFDLYIVQTGQIDKLQQLFQKDVTWKEEKALTVFFRKLDDQSLKREVVMRAISRRCELLTIKLLDCTEFPLPYLIFFLSHMRTNNLLFATASLSIQIKRQLDLPSCNEEIRGLALESAISWNQEELIEEILSKTIPSQNIKQAVILAMQNKKLRLLKKLWRPELITIQDQDEIFRYVAASDNSEIVELLQDPQKAPLPPKETNQNWVFPTIIDDYCPSSNS